MKLRLIFGIWLSVCLGLIFSLSPAQPAAAGASTTFTQQILPLSCTYSNVANGLRVTPILSPSNCGQVLHPSPPGNKGKNGASHLGSLALIPDYYSYQLPGPASSQPQSSSEYNNPAVVQIPGPVHNKPIKAKPHNKTAVIITVSAGAILAFTALGFLGFDPLKLARLISQLFRH